MKNCIQSQGDNIDVTAPRDVTSGEYVLMSDHLGGVASFTAASGADLVIATRGVFALDKTDTGDVFAVGDPVYAGDAGHVQASPASDATAQIGVAVQASGAGATTVATKLVDPTPA